MGEAVQTAGKGSRAKPRGGGAPPADTLTAIERAIGERGGDFSIDREEIAFRCPVHDDHTPSCSWNRRRHVFKCHAAACGVSGGWSELAARLGVERQGARRRVAVYPYRYKNGEEAFRVVRHEPKTFSMQRLDDDGRWIPGVKGIKRVLYRLPEVLAAVRDSRMVYIVEGEKDADTLAQHRLCATTNPNGAGKWRDEFAEHLRGAHVAILPDNDDAGRQHAERVARSVSTVAADVRVVELPGLSAGGDVSDWLTAGGTPEGLATLVEETRPWVVLPGIATHPVQEDSDRSTPACKDTSTQKQPATLGDSSPRTFRNLMSGIDSAPFEEAAEDFARQHVFKRMEPGRLVFELARCLQGVPGAEHAPVELLRTAFDKVCCAFEDYRPGFSAEDRDKRWGEFQHARTQVKVPYGHPGPLRQAWDEAKASPIVLADDGWTPAHNQVAGTAYRLQCANPGRSFFLALAPLARLFEHDDKKHVWRLIEAIRGRWTVANGWILKRTKKASLKDRAAAEFRFNLKSPHYRLVTIEADVGLLAVLLEAIKSSQHAHSCSTRCAAPQNGDERQAMAA